MAVLCVYRINKQRDTSFEFSSILSTVDLSKHLIMVESFENSILLPSVSSFPFFGSRVWLNLYERALSGNDTSIITCSFYFYYEDVRARNYTM